MAFTKTHPRSRATISGLAIHILLYATLVGKLNFYVYTLMRNRYGARGRLDMLCVRLGVGVAIKASQEENENENEGKTGNGSGAWLKS